MADRRIADLLLRPRFDLNRARHGRSRDCRTLPLIPLNPRHERSHTMFTKDKTVGRGAHIRPFEVKKKVIDWDAVGGAIILGLMVIGVLGMIF
jgi:hypothetical protein